MIPQSKNLDKKISTKVESTDVDLNDYINEGKYYFPYSTTPATNIPAGSNGELIVLVGTNFVKQLWFRHGTANSNDYETYVRTKVNENWSDWKRYIIDNDIYYKAGDTIILDNYPVVGHVTSSAKKIEFAVCVPKHLNNKISTITITSGTLTVRGIAGYVQDSYNTPIELTDGTYNVVVHKRTENMLYISVTSPNDKFTNVTNNTPVSVYLNSVTLKFT